MNLLTLPAITTAVALTANGPVRFNARPFSVAVQGNFNYGSGGSSVDAYLQTSIDGGATWIDIAQFHFTTASERYVYNLNAQTPVASEYTATDGSLSSNTAKDGILGRFFRVKYQSTGTYGGGTSLSIDIDCDQV